MADAQDRAEEWRTISGYEGLYQVSSWGRVRSLSYRSKFATIPRLLVLKPSWGRRNNKYAHVTLNRDGLDKRAWVHQLVLLTTDQVRTIRLLASQGRTFTAIAQQIGISLGHVSKIAHRKAWAHVS